MSLTVLVVGLALQDSLRCCRMRHEPVFSPEPYPEP
jgi:hypothetical protein